MRATLAPKPPCSIDGCETESRSRGWCFKHYQRWNNHGDPLVRKNAGPQKDHYEPYPAKQGYMRVNVPGRGVILHHRHVMEQELGRQLTADEAVHHVNGVRGDNRIENLELWNHSQPPGQRVCDKVQWAREILALYQEECP